MKERLFEMLEKPKQFLRDNEKLILKKDRYIVKLKGKIYNKHMIVEANNFNYNTFANTIIFADKDGRNIAFFNRNEVEYVRVV